MRLQTAIAKLIGSLHSAICISSDAVLSRRPRARLRRLRRAARSIRPAVRSATAAGASILPLTPPLCDRCGDPLPTWRLVSVPLAVLPALPARRGRLVDRARAVGAYDGALRAIVHALKYDGRRSLARPLGRLMRERGADVLAGAACAVPVPLHPSRRRAARLQPGGRSRPPPRAAGRARRCAASGRRRRRPACPPASAIATSAAPSRRRRAPRRAAAARSSCWSTM